MQTQTIKSTGAVVALDLKDLQKKARYILWISLIIALAIYLVIIFQSVEFASSDRVEKPLTARFSQRVPHLIKPQELRKRPAYQKCEINWSRANIHTRSPQLLTSYISSIGIKFSASGDRDRALEQNWSGDIGFKLRGADFVIATSKEPERKLDLKTSFLRLEDLDTGRYQSMVIQNPRDKREIRGYFHIKEIMSPSMLEYSEATRRFEGALLDNQFALKGIAEAINTYTGIRADFGKRVAMADRELMDIPWITITTGKSFYPTGNELENLGHYLITSGFLYIDPGSCIGDEIDLNRRDIVKRALAKVGRDCHFYKLAPDHPIYHAYYDFDVVPASGIAGNYDTGRGDFSYPEYLIGVDVDGRLAVVFSYVDIIHHIHKSTYYTKAGNDQRLLQFAINTIVFALTQEGSITHRVMETIK